MEYLTTSMVITNAITYADGRRVDNILGGAVYALQGMKICTDSAMLVASVGQDFGEIYGPFMADNHHAYEGITYMPGRTSFDHITYTPDGRWFNGKGDDYGLRFDLRTTAQQFEKCVSANTKGIYACPGIHSGEWGDWVAMHKRHSYQWMWELMSADCYSKDPDNLELILSLLPDVDIFSLNLPEAKSLFKKDTEEQVVAYLKTLSTPCFFRVGEKGAYFTAKNTAVFVPSMRFSGPGADPTGCGNTSTAAAVYGFSQGMSPQLTVALANISAYFNVQQLGPTPAINDSLRHRALALAKQLSEKAVSV